MATPVLHYFGIGSLGRGEIVRLFLRELGIEFEDKTYEYGPDWASKNEKLGLSKTGKLPVLEIDGHTLYQHIPIIRYLARRAGGYDGDSNYSKFLVDAVSDVYIDWRAAWVANLTEKSPDYHKTVKHFYDIFDDYYSRDTSGPYLLGKQVTYVDFAVYMALDNDARTGGAPDSLPASLAQLKEAIASRPNIKDYLAKSG
jgi:glutathione S-transferase